MAHKLHNLKAWLGVLALAVLGSAGGVLWARWNQALKDQQFRIVPPDPPSAPLVQDPDKCQQLLQQAHDHLRQVPQLGVRLRIRARVFERRMLGAGQYWQRRLSHQQLQTRFQWALQQGTQQVRWQQVCDGRMLWTAIHYPHKRQLTRVNLDELTASSKPSSQVAVPYGLPGLLSQLLQSCRFTHWRETKLQSVPMVALYGTWRPEALRSLVRDPKSLFGKLLPRDRKEFPVHLPQQVVVFLSHRELFPFRIDFRRGRAGEESLVVVLEFFQLQTSPKFQQGLFTFRPGRGRVEDRTQQMLRRLYQARRPKGETTR